MSTEFYKSNRLNDTRTEYLEEKLNTFLVSGISLLGLLIYTSITFMDKPFIDDFTSIATIFNCIVWLLLGVLGGAMLFSFTEYMYEKFLAKRSSKP